MINGEHCQVFYFSFIHIDGCLLALKWFTIAFPRVCRALKIKNRKSFITTGKEPSMPLAATVNA